MTRKEFKAAYRTAIAQEFKHIPAHEERIDCVFSERFTKRMEKLLRSVNTAWWHWVNTAAKLAAVIVAAVLILFSMAMSVEAIRKPVINFFVDIFEKYNLIGFEGDASNVIEKEYQLTWVPEGYTMVDTFKSTSVCKVSLKNAEGNHIYFTQTITGFDGVHMDNEQGGFRHITIDEIPVIIYETNNVLYAVWHRDTYCLTLLSYGKINIETMSQMIRSVQS